MVNLCSVCCESAFKYKCPTCRTPYCSVACYKSHRDHCIPQDKPVQTPSSTVDTTDFCGETEYKYATADTVPLQTLQKLGESAELKNLLRNPHLQNFLTVIDTSDNPPRLMRKAMHEPLFIEFVDECLKIVDPNNTEQLTDQQVLDAIKNDIESANE